MKTRSLLRKLFIALVIILVIIQFFRPAKNNAGGVAYSLPMKYGVPPEVNAIIKPACLDCHSNNTRYPWYSQIQPIAWWMANHVNEGKKHLNLTEFTNRPVAYQYHKFEEMVEMVKEKEMPLPSYTWFGLHPDAKLTDEQRDVFTLWAQSKMAQLEAIFPPDSLVMKRR